MVFLLLAIKEREKNIVIDILPKPLFYRLCR